MCAWTLLTHRDAKNLWLLSSGGILVADLKFRLTSCLQFKDELFWRLPDLQYQCRLYTTKYIDLVLRIYRFILYMHLITALFVVSCRKIDWYCFMFLCICVSIYYVYICFCELWWILRTSFGWGGKNLICKYAHSVVGSLTIILNIKIPSIF